MKTNKTQTPRRGDKLRYTAFGMLLAFALMALLTPTLAAVVYRDMRVFYNDIAIYVDGEKITPMDVNGTVVDPFVSDGTTYLPIRAIGQAFGKTVEWDGEANAIYIGGRPRSAPVDPTRKTIYVIIRVFGNQTWPMETGARKAGEDLGCNVIVVGAPVNSQAENQIALLRDAAALADAIVIEPLDRVALAGPISEQFWAGMPIVLIGATVATEDYSAAYLTDNYQAGRLAAVALHDKLKAVKSPEEEGVIAVTIGSTGSQAILDRNAGFQDWWDANAPKAWTVLWDDIKVNEGDAKKAMDFGLDFIDRYPNLIGLFAPNNGSAVGFAKALEASGRTDISMVGFDFSDEMQAIIRNPDFSAATILQRQYFMGYDSVAKALALANGGTVDHKVVDTGTMVVDRINIDTTVVKEAIGR